MRLNQKLFLFFIIIYIFFSFILWFYSNQQSNKINEIWMEKLVKNQVLFDKNRTLIPILNELKIIEEMSNNKDILDFFINENNPIIKEKGLKTLEKYRLELKEKNYFLALANSKNYYYQNSIYPDVNPKYQLSQNNKNDKWFFDVLKMNNSYQINVNKDSVLGITKVWINYLLKNNNQLIGVIGTGFELKNFIKETVDVQQEGIRNIFINQDMAIQLDRNDSLIDFSTISKSSNEIKTLDLIIKDKLYLNQIRTNIDLIKNENPNSIKILWIKTDGKKSLLAISYLKDVDWYNITIIDNDKLFIFDWSKMFILLTILFVFMFILIAFLSDKFFLLPLEQKIHEEIENRSYLEKENLKKDRLIAIQTRFLSIGNTIENIIHQWKIPLVRAGSLLSEIEAISYLNKDRKDMVEINKVTENLREHMKIMQGTLDEFYNFYQTNEKIEEFNIKTIIYKSWDMLNAKSTMLNAEINIIDNYKSNIFSYSTYLSQVFIILIDNFLNNVKEKNINGAIIIFEIEHIINNKIQITIKDNYKIMSKKIDLTNIFESTSKKSNIDLDLVFARIFIKDKLNGDMYIKNLNNSIKFILQIPINIKNQ